MARLRVRELAEQYRIPRTRLARRADIGATTMERMWQHPEDVHVLVSTLEVVARAMTAILHEEKHLDVTICIRDLIDESIH